MSSLRSTGQIFVALSVSLALITPPKAFADLPAPRIWLAPTTHDGSTKALQLSARVHTSLKKYLRKTKRFRVEDGKMPKVARRATDGRVAKAESYKYTAIQAFRAGKYEEAEETLKVSLKLYQDAVASVRELDALYQVLIYLGATYTMLDYGGDAKDFYRQLAAVVPGDYKLPSDIPPKAVKAYEKERKRLLKKKKGALTIESEPAGAQVKVNGVERGVSPCEVRDLPRGTHYVQLVKEGAGKAGSLAKVKAGYATPLKYSLREGPIVQKAEPVTPEQLKRINDQISAGKIGQELRAIADEVGGEQEVQGVLVSHLLDQGGELKLFLYVYVVDEKTTFWLTPQAMRASLSSAQVTAMKSVSDLEEIFPRFPVERQVDGEHAPFTEALKKSKLVAAGVKVSTGPKPIATLPTKAPAKRAGSTLPPPSNPALLPPPPAPEEDEDDAGAWYTSTWLWASVGVVALGAAGVGGYYMIENQNKVKNFNGEVVW